MKVDILAVGAHPDDVELACSGTIATAVKLGYAVAVIDLTEGELSTRGTRTLRAKEAGAASRVLGCLRENLHLPDGNIEVNQENILKLVTLLRKYRPRIMLIPHTSERHPDHVHAHHLCREARFYSGLRKVKTKLKGKQQEPWRPGKSFHFMQWYLFTPSFIVDISDVYETRVKAILTHRSQFYDPHSSEPQTLLSQKSFLELLETRARHFGQQIGARYGEPFYSEEPIGVTDIFDLKFFEG